MTAQSPSLMAGRPHIAADLLISGATIVTMDADRRVIGDGAIAIAGDRIVAVGKREALARTVDAKETLNAERFVAAPGFVDAHIHITGDPLTRGFGRGGEELDSSERLTRWTIPIFRAHSPSDEALSARCAALTMMRGGTTAFLEAGTITHLDAVMEALTEAGIRGRVGEWVEGRAYGPDADQAKSSAAAIAQLESEVARHPDEGGARLAAWPILVGHSTNPDEVWRAAKALADDHGLGVSAHMSPRRSDPQWFLTRYGRRPLEHLAELGVLGENVALTHLARVDDREVDILAASGARAILCPHAAVLGGFGLADAGRHPEMIERGVTLALGTDGMSATVLEASRMTAGLYRDARERQFMLSPGEMLELATLNGARVLGMADSIGSLEVGKKADIVLHDADLPEWGAIFDPAGQLATEAPAHGVHSVWIDGVKVIEAGRATWVDEAELMVEVRRAGAALVARTGLPSQPVWPVQ